MISEQLQNELDQEAKAESKKLTGRVPIFRMGYEAGHYDGAERYAEKWQQAEQKIKELRKWQEEAGSLLDPLLEWGQAQKDIPLGCSITVEILRRAKLYTEAEQRAERLINEIENIMDFIAESKGGQLSDVARLTSVENTLARTLASLTLKTSTDGTTNG